MGTQTQTYVYTLAMLKYEYCQRVILILKERVSRLQWNRLLTEALLVYVGLSNLFSCKSIHRLCKM